MEAASIFINTLSSYKYILLFPGLVFEGPILTFVAAFLSSPVGGQVFNVFILCFVVILADIVGDIMYYSIGRWGGRRIIRRYGAYFGVTEERLDYIRRYFKRHGKKTIAIAKISHGLGWPVMVVAGSVHIPFKQFIAFTSIVSVVKSIVFVAIGYWYGESYKLLHQYVSLAGFLITTIALVGLIAVIISLLKKRKEG